MKAENVNVPINFVSDLKSMVEMVKEFHNTYSCPIAESPAFPDDKLRQLRVRLLNEEVMELNSAMVNEDMIEVADGIVDCLYILIGTAITYGIADALPNLFAEVHHSNMSKLHDGKVVKREDGKVIKGPQYTPPQLGKIISEFVNAQL